MTSSAISSFATYLKLGDGGTPEAFTTIAEVMDISGPELSADTEEVTSHSSTDGWKEKIITLLDGGDVTFELNFIPTGATHSYAAGLLKDLANRTRRNFQHVFPNVGATTWSFSAYVTKFPVRAPVNGVLRVPVTLTLTGKPTLV